MAGAAIALAGCVTGAPVENTPTSTPPPPGRHLASAPEKVVDPDMVYANERLAGMTLPQKVACLFVLHYPGTDAGAIRAFIDGYGLGGVILMGDNIPGTPAELAGITAGLSADPALPALIMVDQEGGIVSRLPFDVAPGADVLKSEPVHATTDAFASRSDLLASVGINVNLGIVADVTDDPSSFIYDRVLGTDPASAAERVGAAVAAEQGAVASTIKHFPGHGQAPGDSHVSVPVAPLGYEEWLTQSAPPFVAGIDAGAELVMLGHLAYPAIDQAPAGLSPVWHRVLRDDLGFTGVIISDDMLMLQHTGLPEYQDPAQNAIRALAAGTGMLLYVLPADPATEGIDVGGLIAAVVSAVETGQIDRASIDGAARKAIALRRSLSPV